MAHPRIVHGLSNYPPFIHCLPMDYPPTIIRDLNPQRQKKAVKQLGHGSGHNRTGSDGGDVQESERQVDIHRWLGEDTSHGSVPACTQTCLLCTCLPPCLHDDLPICMLLTE